MKIFKMLVFALLYLQTLHCGTASTAINAQNKAIVALNQLNTQQNTRLKRIINVDKKIAYEQKYSNFLMRQRNELIVNYFHLRGAK